MDILAELQWRGLINQTTDENLQAWLNEKPRTMYIGFDPTADSLHVGSMLQVMQLRRFQQAGHKVIALVGGATGMIGDPSGKSAERNLLSSEQLDKNLAGIREQMLSFLDFDGANPAQLVNNFDWMKEFSYLEFLRDIGKNFPVNVMMAKDSVKSRLSGDSGISYTEFSYMLLQAYDFVHLNRAYGCELQVGGSDQWGNITAGIDLGRRMHSVQLYGVTGPLLTKADGSKMGKSESGAIWLSPERTSPYEFYQYWINVDDQDVGKCLRFLTELPQETIAALDESCRTNPGAKESQKTLAVEVTRLVHGEDGLEAAQRMTQALFKSDIRSMDPDDVKTLLADVPGVDISRAELQGEGLSVIDAFVRAELSKSKGEARRDINGNAVNVNDERITAIDARLTESDIISGNVILLRRGKKRRAVLRVID